MVRAAGWALLSVLGLGACSEDSTGEVDYVPNGHLPAELSEQGWALLQAALPEDCEGPLANPTIEGLASQRCIENATRTVWYATAPVHLDPESVRGCGSVAVVELPRVALQRMAGVTYYFGTSLPEESCSRSFVTVAVWVERDQGWHMEGFFALVGVPREVPNEEGEPYQHCWLVSVEGEPTRTGTLSESSQSGSSLLLADDPGMSRVRLVVGAGWGCNPVAVSLQALSRPTVYPIGDNVAE